jgi:Astacin (Peptidase family M12A)
MSDQAQPASMAQENQEEIHACVDAVLPLAMQEEAMQRAVNENPANQTEKIDPQTGKKAFVVTGKLWKPGRTLRVKFVGGTAAVRDKVKQYANEWSEYVNIKFDFRDDEDAEIRVAFVKDGSWSYIGTDALSIAKERSTMNYGWFDQPVPESEYSRVIIHEFGHALGMPHEHNHPTTDIPWNKEAVYRYYQGPPNNWTKAQVDNNLFAKYAKTITQFSAFDRDSIMLYPIAKEFVTDPNFAVGMNTKLSDTDKKFMAQIYPKQ